MNNDNGDQESSFIGMEVGEGVPPGEDWLLLENLEENVMMADDDTEFDFDGDTIQLAEAADNNNINIPEMMNQDNSLVNKQDIDTMASNHDEFAMAIQHGGGGGGGGGDGGGWDSDAFSPTSSLTNSLAQSIPNFQTNNMVTPPPPSLDCFGEEVHHDHGHHVGGAAEEEEMRDNIDVSDSDLLEALQTLEDHAMIEAILEELRLANGFLPNTDELCARLLRNSTVQTFSQAKSLNDFDPQRFQIKTFQPKRRVATNTSGQNEIEPGSHALIITYFDPSILPPTPPPPEGSNVHPTNNTTNNERRGIKFGGQSMYLRHMGVKRQNGDHKSKGLVARKYEKLDQSLRAQIPAISPTSSLSPTPSASASSSPSSSSSSSSFPMLEDPPPPPPPTVVPFITPIASPTDDDGMKMNKETLKRKVYEALESHDIHTKRKVIAALMRDIEEEDDDESEDGDEEDDDDLLEAWTFSKKGKHRGGGSITKKTTTTAQKLDTLTDSELMDLCLQLYSKNSDESKWSKSDLKERKRIMLEISARKIVATLATPPLNDAVEPDGSSTMTATVEVVSSSMNGSSACGGGSVTIADDGIVGSDMTVSLEAMFESLHVNDDKKDRNESNMVEDDTITSISDITADSDEESEYGDFDDSGEEEDDEYRKALSQINETDLKLDFTLKELEELKVTPTKTSLLEKFGLHLVKQGLMEASILEHLSKCDATYDSWILAIENIKKDQKMKKKQLRKKAMLKKAKKERKQKEKTQQAAEKDDSKSSSNNKEGNCSGGSGSDLIDGMVVNIKNAFSPQQLKQNNKNFKQLFGLNKGNKDKKKNKKKKEENQEKS